MENGAFAQKRANAPFSIIFFKYMIFHWRQKALLWSKGLSEQHNYTEPVFTLLSVVCQSYMELICIKLIIFIISQQASR